jgi:hypothetical protein
MILNQTQWDMVRQTVTVEEAQIIVVSFGTMTKTPNVTIPPKTFNGIEA